MAEFNARVPDFQPYDRPRKRNTSGIKILSDRSALPLEMRSLNSFHFHQNVLKVTSHCKHGMSFLCLHESRGPVCIDIIPGEKTAKKTGVLYDSVVVSLRFRWQYLYCRTMVSRQHQRLLCHSNDESGICLTHSGFLLTTNQDFVLVSEEP